MQKAAKAHRRDLPPRSRGCVLVVEDEHDLQDLLRFNLEREGYSVMTADTGERALDLAQRAAPDLILLDLMLPGVDGLTVCKTLRAEAATASIPVVMLTAKGEEADIVLGLELGADDYITKPFSPRVLLARIGAVLRRGEDNSTDNQVIRHDALVIDPSRHSASIGDETLVLTATEFKLLHVLVSHAGRVYTRQQLIETLHDEHTVVTERSIDVHVVSLRRKLTDMGTALQTVRGIGYRFAE